MAIVGVTSPSMIVPTPWARVITAFCAPVSWTSNSEFGFAFGLARIGTVIVCTVWPGLNVREPVVAV